MSHAIADMVVATDRRARVVDLAKTGKPYRAIGLELGVNASTVARDIAAWAAETKPSVEATEELRKLQREEILALREKLWARIDDDDRLAVVDRLVRLQEREAKLMGLDLTQQINIGINVSAEAIASLFADHEAGVIEGTAVEVTDA